MPLASSGRDSRRSAGTCRSGAVAREFSDRWSRTRSSAVPSIADLDDRPTQEPV